MPASTKPAAAAAATRCPAAGPAAPLSRSAKSFTPGSTPKTGPAKPSASSLPPQLPQQQQRPRRQLSRDAIKAIQARMRDIDHGGRTFEWMLHNLLKRHHDLVDPEQIEAQAKRPQFPETCSRCIGAVALHSVRALRNAGAEQLDPETRAKHAAAAADMCGAAPCDAIRDIIDSVVSEERAKHGAFLLQDPCAVFGQVEMQLVFDSPSTTRRMRRFKEACPAAVARIKQFLCGPGFHSAPPKASNDEAWTSLMTRLRFDAIRDNRTPIYTELSKHWKKRHTAFEQFAHFLAFRDSLPAHFTLNMLTHGQKPTLVAALCGDTTAFVLLARLGFAVPSDVQWDRTPFLRDSLDTRRHAVLRHLNTYFFRRQFKNPAPIVVQTLIAPPGPSGLPNGSTAVLRMQQQQQRAGTSPALEPMPAMELPPTLMSDNGLPMNHPAMRVWEPRPPRKNTSNNASHSTNNTHTQQQSVAGGTRRSPIHDVLLAATLPDISPAARPANAGTPSGAMTWANLAAQRGKETSPQHGGGSPPQNGGSLPRSNMATPAAPPVPTPTPVHGAAKTPASAPAAAAAAGSVATPSSGRASKTPKAAPADKAAAPAKAAAASTTSKTPVHKHTDPTAAAVVSTPSAAPAPAATGYAAAARAPPKPAVGKKSAVATPASNAATPKVAPRAAASPTPKSTPATPAAAPKAAAAPTGTPATPPAAAVLGDAPGLPSATATAAASRAAVSTTPTAAPADSNADTPSKRKNAWGV